MRHREAAELEIGIQRLDVSQDGFAGRGVAVVADGITAGQRRYHPRVAEIVADQAHSLVRMEPPGIEGDDAGGFLAAMLQRVQAERGHRGRVGYVPDTEHAAFFVQLVVVGFRWARFRHFGDVHAASPTREPAVC